MLHVALSLKAQWYEIVSRIFRQLWTSMNLFCDTVATLYAIVREAQGQTRTDLTPEHPIIAI